MKQHTDKCKLQKMKKHKNNGKLFNEAIRLSTRQWKHSTANLTRAVLFK